MSPPCLDKVQYSVFPQNKEDSILYPRTTERSVNRLCRVEYIKNISLNLSINSIDFPVAADTMTDINFDTLSSILIIVDELLVVHRQTKVISTAQARF